MQYRIKAMERLLGIRLDPRIPIVVDATGPECRARHRKLRDWIATALMPCIEAGRRDPDITVIMPISVKEFLGLADQEADDKTKPEGD